MQISFFMGELHTDKLYLFEKKGLLQISINLFIKSN